MADQIGIRVHTAAPQTHTLARGDTMGYRVEYESAGKRARSSDKPAFRPGTLTAAFLLFFCLLVNACWPRGREVMQAILWPGDPETTQQAVEAFVAELQDGAPLGDAVEGFCREIIQYADIPG